MPPLTMSIALSWKSPGIMFELMSNTLDMLGAFEMSRATVLMVLPAFNAVAVKYASVFPDGPDSLAPTSMAMARKRSRRVRSLIRIS